VKQYRDNIAAYATVQEADYTYYRGGSFTVMEGDNYTGQEILRCSLCCKGRF